MIPRTKVNYGLSDILKTVFAGNDEGSASRALAQRLETLLGQQNVLLTSSGRNALHLLLTALPHKTVIVPSYTCKAVVEAVLLAQKQVAYIETEGQACPSAWPRRHRYRYASIWHSVRY